MLEQEGKSFPERLLETSSHKAINYGVDRGVGVGHAVGPRLDLVCGIVRLVVRIERLEEDKDLDGPPADGKEKHNHYHHLGNFAPDADCSLRQEIHLKRQNKEPSL